MFGKGSPTPPFPPRNWGIAREAARGDGVEGRARVDAVAPHPPDAAEVFRFDASADEVGRVGDEGLREGDVELGEGVGGGGVAGAAVEAGLGGVEAREVVVLGTQALVARVAEALEKGVPARGDAGLVGPERRVVGALVVGADGGHLGGRRPRGDGLGEGAAPSEEAGGALRDIGAPGADEEGDGRDGGGGAETERHGEEDRGSPRINIPIAPPWVTMPKAPVTRR